MRGPFIAKSEQRIANDAPFNSRYIANVLSLVREHRWFFLTVALAALALRLFFLRRFPRGHRRLPRLCRPRHQLVAARHLWPDAGAAHRAHRHAPARISRFLAIIFWLFGAGNFKAVMLAQIVFDLATCLIVADIARRMLSTRAAKIAFLLASLCPFLANYSAAVLTETLEIFFTVSPSIARSPH